MKLIARGAEAEIYLDKDTILKKRPVKSYRHPKLDQTLRRSRTRREAKVLEKLKGLPELIHKDDKEMELRMTYIDGQKLRDVLTTKLSTELGKKVAKMHDAGIIHGDLTTSNTMVMEGKIYLIDFGLSYFSEKIEDKAVDLHILRQALKSRHHAISKKAFTAFLKGYKSSEEYDAVLNRLEKVEARGRNKKK